MSVRILQGHALSVLKTLPAESVQCVVTSPPYWALRAYGTEHQVWGGDPEHDHAWGELERAPWANDVPGPNTGGKNAGFRIASKTAGTFCCCGAWSGELGQEPTPELFIEHLVLIFREVRRVLKRDGTLWCNIGDSYAGSGKGPSNSLQRPASCLNDGQLRSGVAPVAWVTVPEGTKPKDLVGIPWMLAFALRADGWYLRSDIRWCKRAPMPESVKDRPTSAVEDVFLLSKSERYFYNPEGAREPAVSTHPSGNGYDRPEQISKGGRGQATGWQPVPDRNMRNYWVLNPEPFPGAHFATFPPELPRRCIEAGTRKGDLVLDPFGGAGTVGLVADRLARDVVLIELSAEYAELARNRIERDQGPMLDTSVTVERPVQLALDEVAG